MGRLWKRKKPYFENPKLQGSFRINRVRLYRVIGLNEWNRLVSFTLPMFQVGRVHIDLYWFLVEKLPVTNATPRNLFSYCSDGKSRTTGIALVENSSCREKQGDDQNAQTCSDPQ